MRAVLVIGGLGLLPLAVPALYLLVRRPSGPARFVPFLVTAVLGLVVAAASWLSMAGAEGFRDLALTIPLMIGLTTTVGSLIAIGVLRLRDPAST